MKQLRRFRTPLGWLMILLVVFWQIGSSMTPLRAATLYWDPDGSATNNDVIGTNLGGSGTWNTSNVNWWNLLSETTWPNTNVDRAIFTGPELALVVPNTVTLASGITANQLKFERSGYTLTGGTLTLAGVTPGVYVDMGETAVINSVIQGTDGFTKTGRGTVRLGNAANTYTGITSITNGALVISNPAALGADTSTIVVSGSATRGFGGGTLVLEGGYGTGMTLTRNLSLQGMGPIADRSAALVNVGNNVLSGTVNTAVGSVTTRITSHLGLLEMSGTVDVAGTAGTTLLALGSVNGTGTGSYAITGILTGTGTVEKTSGGTLILDPTDTSGFSGTIRVGGSVTGTQSTVRITSADVLGTRNATGTNAVLDLNGGVLEVRMDTPSVMAGGTTASVYGRASSTIFADHSMGGQAINGTVTFNQLTYEDNITVTLNSRNGYGMTFTSAPVNGGDNNSTITNNLGGLLTFTGNVWSNANDTANRTLTIGGNGNTLITGNLVASSAAFNHSLTKTGSGSLTITSTGSTLDGNVNINGGAVRITDFRSITNNTSTINIGTTTTGGVLIIGTDVAATAAGLTTSKVINLAGTTGGATIYANQTGADPVVLNANFTATGAGAKTLTLGGTNTADNIINGVIVDSSSATSLAKNGTGTWVLAGENTFTGGMTITNGVLKIKDTYSGGVSRNVIGSTAAITFNAVTATGEAGGTLEYVGAAGSPSSETLGALTPTAGANTVKVTPGAGGTATLTFTSLGTVNNSASVNFVAPFPGSIVVTGKTGYDASRLYFNGADFAFFDVGGVVRAANYGVDANFSAANTFIAGNHALITANSSTGAITQRSVKLQGDVTLNLTGTLTLNNGASNTAGNILATGGNSIIQGSAITGPGTNVLGIRVDLATDTLTINSNITGVTGGLNKNGEGKLILNGTGNTITGETRINEGEIELGAASRLGGDGSTTFTALTMRGQSVLDVGGNSIGVTSLNGTGVITNDSATAATLTVGQANGTGTWNGVFQDGSGELSVTKVGTGAQTWSGLSTYTGVTTIGSTGLVTVNVLADIGVASGIGAGDATNNATNAASLVFNGSTGGLVYTGALVDGALTLGSTSASTNRLFTLAGSGVTLSSTASNNNAIVFSNMGDIVHGVIGPQSIILTGTSTGDNTLNPRITDSGTGSDVTSVTKTGTGVWVLGNNNNTYSGLTTVSNGILVIAQTGGLSANSNLVMDGGVLQMSGLLNRTLGGGAGQLQFGTLTVGTAKFVGFAAGNSKLTVNFSGNPVWGSTSGFVENRNGLQLNSTIALSEVEVTGGFSLGTAANPAKAVTVNTSSGSSTVTFVGGTDTSTLVVGQVITNPNIPAGSYIVSINSSTQITISANATATASNQSATVEASTLRAIRVDDNTNTGTDFATISSVISGDAGTGIKKVGGGMLQLFGDNTYSGETNVAQGTLVVRNLGSAPPVGPGTSSNLGDTTFANTTAGALTLGSGAGAGILQYVGTGEVTNRMIRLNSTGSNQIHADGTGALVLTNVVNDAVSGPKTLVLRGSNTSGNMITSQLSDFGGALGITIDGGATWILTNGSNNYTGTTAVNAGALGIGADTALGTGGISVSNSTIFAYGADRTVENAITHVNNTTQAFSGDYSLNFTNTYALAAAANNVAINNTIVDGKTLILGNVTADAMTATRTLTIGGSGHTIISGAITTSTLFGLNITYNGTGTLTLAGTGSDWNTGTLTVSNGTLRLGANEVITDGAGNGNVVFNPGAGATATFDLNGSLETINGFTATSAGNTVIDNTSDTLAALIFGANDAAVNFGEGGTGTYTITDSGAGALSLIKTGVGAAVIGKTATLTYQGTTSVTGGSMTINAALNGSTGLSVTGVNSALALKGGIANTSVITSVTVGDGSALSLVSGGGDKLNNLTNLSLGTPGGTSSILSLDVGDSLLAGDNLNTDLLALLGGGTLTLENTILLYLTDAGLHANTTYNLITSASGPLTAATWQLGGSPGGFSSLTLNVTAGVVSITTGNLVTAALYWNGNGPIDVWNDSLNWSTDKAGAVAAGTTPGQATDVVFVANTIAGGTLTTTLEQSFRIHSLTFEASGAPGTTPTSVIINPGALATNRLEIDPSNSALGISIAAGGPPSVTIAAPLRIGADQTWNVTDAASTLTISGGLQGEADVTKTGSGRVVLSGVADPQFNVGLTSDFVVNAGSLEIQTVGALGSTVNNNLANVVVNSGGAFYFFGASSTTANNITLNGGALSAGSATQTYSGAINISANSFINMRDSNSATLTTTARNITLSGVLSGAGKLSVDSVNTASSGNQITGTLTLSNNNSGWSGGIDLLRGTVTATNVNALGTGNITASLGRIIFNTAGGAAFNVNQNITLDAPGGTLELQADASGTPVSDLVVNFNGTITLGSAANANMALRLFTASDNFSVLNINGPVVLGNNASISTAGSSRVSTISGVISGAFSLAVNDDFGGWNQTNQTLRLLGLNTFTGGVLVGGGILEFNTVSNNGGPASSLGMGTDGITLAGGTLSFMGDGAANSQTTNRAISLTASSGLAANGTNGATITYTGAITSTGNNTLTLSGTGTGFLTGGFTQPAGTADLVMSSGTWTISGGTVVLADDLLHNGGTLNIENVIFSLNDDIVVTGSTSVLNLNTTGVWTPSNPAGTSSFLFVRGGAVVNLNANDVNGVNNANGTEGILLGDGTTSGIGTMNTNGFNITVPRLDVGGIATGFEGRLLGSGLVTVNYTGTDYNQGIRLFRGLVQANLAGSAPILKQGLGDATLSGDNSGLTGATNAPTRIDAGNLILDYTTSNTQKIPATRGLDMRGGTLTLNGNASAATTQSVTSLTLANGGASKIDLNSNGTAVTLNLGAITRAPLSTDGTIRFELPVLGSITTTTANVNGILGGYATVKTAAGVTNFAANDGSGNIVAVTSTGQDDVSLWDANANISDVTGFFGTSQTTTINSLRFNANGSSNVTLGVGKMLTLSSGGILMTDKAASGSHSISGGLLNSANRELIFTQDSVAQALTVSSGIVLGAIAKSGNGTLTLSGINHYTGATDIQAGMVIAAGGSAIGDSSAVILSDDQASTLFLTDDETIGTLAGGNAGSGITVGVMDVGTHTLTLRGGSSYAGTFAGSGTIIRDTSLNGANLNLTGSTTTAFTGSVIVNGGLLQLSGSTGRLSGATSFTINKGGNFLIDNNDDNSPNDRLSNTAAFTLNSADGTFSGATLVRGLAIRTDNNGNEGETIGVLTFGSGASYFTGEASGGTSAIAAIIADNFLRTNSATLNARGRNLGGTSAERTQLRIGTAANETAFIGTGNNANLVGGGGAAGTKTISIVPWAIGENLTGAAVDANMGNSLVTYVAGAGFRPLNLTTEYNTFATRAGATDNIRESLTADLTAIPGVVINALVLHNNNTAASTINVTGAGVAETLTVTSGALLFTLNSAATASSAHNIVLSGFGGGIVMGGAGITDEYVIHVVNPSSAANTPTLTATIGSPLTSVADITKAGRGTLVLTVANTAGGGTKKTTINEGTLEIGDLDYIGGNTGGLVFAGGTFRLGTGFIDDLSLRAITFLQGGGTIDTNGISLALANSIGGGGAGGFTKTGLGTLTFNAAASYAGPTVIANGGVTAGIDNALPTGTDLTVGSGTTAATLTLGAFNQTVASLSSTANNATASNIVVSAGKTLTVNGDVTLSNNTDNAVTNLNISGGGAMVVNGGMFIVGRNTSGTDSSSRATLNLSGLSSFTANLTGVLQIQAQGDNNAAHISSLILSNTANTITASAIQVGASATSGQHLLVLGAGTNVINSTLIEVGVGGRDGGLISFGGNATGTLTIRDASGTGRAIFNMGTMGGSGTAATAANGFDVTGHNADLLFGEVTIGTQNRGNTYTNTFSFNQGTLDMTSLTMSTRTANAGTGTVRSTTSTMNLGGGIVNIQNGIVNLGMASGAYGSANAPIVNATINITGGTVNIGDTNGVAIRMAEYTATGGTGTGSANGVVNITGGTVTVDGDIVRVTNTVNASAVVTLNGSTAVLDMTGDEIGSATSFVTFNAEQGTLMNLGELNGGAGLTKTGLLTLILEGLNSYTGGTTVNAGILQVGSGGATGNLGSGTVNIADANAIVRFNRNNTYTVTNNITGTGKVEQTGTGVTVLEGNNDYSGGTSIDAGTLQVNSSGALGTVGEIKFGGGTLQYTANNTADYSTRIANSTGAVRVDTNGQTVTYANTLVSSNTGGLFKAGTGTLRLNAANAYAGATTVDAGKLVANNTTALSSGDVTVNAAGTLAIGDAARLNVDIGGSLNSTGTLEFDIFSRQAGSNPVANNDLITLNSADTGDSISLTGTLRVVDTTGTSATAWTVNDMWQLIDWATFASTNIPAASTSYGGFSVLDLPTLNSGLAWNVITNATGLYISVAIVPEPSRMLLLALGFVLLIFRRRRR